MLEIESLITLSVIGFAAGFFFSVPVAGPVSIIITSHALKGDRHFALFTASGAALVDILYCFIAVFGFTQLFAWYQPYIPYALLIGAFFLFYIGFRVRRTNLDLDHFDEQNKVALPARRFQRRGKFFTGLTINFLNPSLFFGWLTSSFFILSLAASLGLNVGGLDNVLSNNVESINDQSNQIMLNGGDSSSLMVQPAAPEHKKPQRLPGKYQLLNSASYAMAVGVGSVVWFYLFSGFLIRHRKKLKIQIINKIIHGLGYALWVISVYLFYEAWKLLF